MPTQNRTVKPGRNANTVLSESGEELLPPAGWQLLPPGDGTLTRMVKAKGPTWLVQVKVGRRTISRGVWACRSNIEAAQTELRVKRQDPGHAVRRKREQLARDRKQRHYVLAFYQEVILFLNFHQRHAAVAEILAERVTALATPVGSGTVARTQRIPVAERAKAAVVAWLRHQVTDYDRMSIARVKGRRREVRRQLAEKSLQFLQPYRLGEDIPLSCPLARTLQKTSSEPDRQGGTGG